MERSGNFYKAIQLGYILISILCPIIKEEIHRKLEILYALADFLLALSEIFLALSVRELTI